MPVGSVLGSNLYRLSSTFFEEVRKLINKSRHMVVFHVAQETRANDRQVCIYRSKKGHFFTTVYSSTLLEQKQTNFSMLIPLGWGTFKSEFQLNPPSCYPFKFSLYSPYHNTFSDHYNLLVLY